MRFLKQSTTVTVQMGPALDKTDGVTEETALSPTVEVSKAGAAFAARSSATAITHDSNGWYRVELNTTDTGTLGPLVAKFDDAATHLPVWHEFMVVPANVYDSLVGGSDVLTADVTQWNGTNVGTPHTAGYPVVTVKDGTGTGEIDTNAGAVVAVTTVTNLTNDPSGVTTLLSRLSATRAGYLDNLSAGAVATAAKLLSYFQSALRSDVTVDADIGGTYDDATDSLQALRDRGDAAWTTADVSGLATAAALAVVDANVDDILVDTSTTLQAEVDDIQSRLPAALVGGRMDASVGAMASNVLTAAALAADAVAEIWAGITGAAGNFIADHVLRRSWASAASSSAGAVDTKSFRSLLGAAAKLVNRVAVSGGTLTVYESDDTTSLGTQAVTTDAAADPIVEVNTA